MLPGVAASHSQRRRRDIEVLSCELCVVSCERIPTHNSKLTTQNLSCRLAVSARSRAAHEYLFSIEVFHEHADALTLSALGLIREHLDLGSNRQTGLRDAIPEEIDRRSAFDAPVGHFAVLARHIDPQPGVRIDQLHFCNLALQVDRLIFIESCRERMMCTHWNRDQK